MGLNASSDRSNHQEPAPGSQSRNPERSSPVVTGRTYVIAMDADELFDRIASLPSNTILVEQETLCLAVEDWETDEPSLYLITDDGTPFDGTFEDHVQPAGNHLEFRLKFPLDYPGGRPGFLGCTRNFLWNKTSLGITCIFLDQSAEAYLKTLKKSVSKKNRPRFSQAVSAFGTQVSWAQDFSKPNLINFRVRIDKEEAALMVVDSESKEYKEEFGSDKQKFINASILPLRVLLRVAWWKDHTRTKAVRLAIENRLQQQQEEPEASQSTNPENQWWWPIVLEEQRKSRARAAASGDATATGRSETASNDPTDHNISAEPKLPSRPSSSNPPSEYPLSEQPPSEKSPSEHLAFEKPASEQPSLRFYSEHDCSDQPSPSKPLSLQPSSHPLSDTSETATSDHHTQEDSQQLSSCSNMTSSKSKKKAKKEKRKQRKNTTPQQMDSSGTKATAEQPSSVISEAPGSVSATNPSSVSLSERETPLAELTSTPLLHSDNDHTKSEDVSLESKDSIPKATDPLSEQNDSRSSEPPRSACVPPENRIENTDKTTVTDSLSLSYTLISLPSPRTISRPTDENLESSELLEVSSTPPIPLHSPQVTFRPTDESLEFTESSEVAPLTESYTRLQLTPLNTNIPSELSSPTHQLSRTDSRASEDEHTSDLGDNQRRRADAIRLIRARTLSRLSPAEESATKDLPTQHGEDSFYYQESTDSPTVSETATASTTRKKNRKKKKSKQRSDQPTTLFSGNDTTHYPYGFPSQGTARVTSTGTTAEQGLSSQVSPTESVPKETTQVPASHPSLLQTHSNTLKSKESPGRKDRKSILDPLALEYIPNYQSGDTSFLSRSKESSSTSSSYTSERKQRLGIESSARESRDTTKGKRKIATAESASNSPDILASSICSRQRLSKNDTDFSFLSSPNDRLSTTSASQEKESSKIQDDNTISALRTTDTEHNTNQRTPASIFETGADLRSSDLSSTGYPVEERRAVISQSPTPSAEHSQARRASRTSIRERLSPIHESPFRQDTTSAAEHSHPDMPDTPSTESITPTTQELSIGTQSNRETEQVELMTLETTQDRQGIVTSSSTASSNFASSHAHPAPSSTQSGLGGPTIQRPPGFFWQLDSHGFPCAKADCDKRCNSWDGASVICPRCGPFSEVRYCGPEHLYADVKQHWVYCGRMTFRHPCRENTIPREQREGPPLLPSRHQWDTPERHRQAVHHATNRGGDYFIFDDWAEFAAAGQPANNAAVRCTNRVLCVVKFDDPEEKDRFRRVLGVCLFASIEVTNLVDYLFRLIRDNLRTRGEWSGELDVALRYQIQHELSVALPPGLTGQRHACETEWDGRNARHCQDPVCSGERRTLLGDLGMGRGFHRLCDYLESSHWLLRAARLTHPTVAQVAARTRGEGFDEVLEEDRRVFRRGEGWDGAGSGEMEIEGVNV